MKFSQLKCVKDMYELSKTNNEPLLSRYGSTFWNTYLNNYERYDKLFCRLYKSFKPFSQERTQPIEDVLSDFTDEVYNHLLLNDKRYSELYRVEVLPDDDYSIIDNYDVTETMQRTTGNNTTDNYGNTEYTRNEDMGSREDTNTYSQGSQLNTGTNKVAPFDSESFYNDTNVTDNIGAREDSNNAKIGSQSNVISETRDAYLDTHETQGTENYTLRKKGNIGVMTSTDVIQKAVDFWKLWEFYSLVFREIAEQLLIV